MANLPFMGMRMSWVVMAGAGVCCFGTVVGAMLEIVAAGPDGQSMPCRIHLVSEGGESVRPPELPFWRGGFVCEGKVSLEVAAGRYRYTVERGPEWKAVRGEVVVQDRQRVAVQLERLVDLKREGWHGGDLHVHRGPHELPLHLRAEDLSIASVQTWWNKTNLWGERVPEEVVQGTNGRLFHVLSGEDERGGGALLYHRAQRPIDISAAEREWPSSATFLEMGEEQGCWVEIEKPFWWDTPLWLSTGLVESVGIAQNHMQRSGMLDNEAWGRARNREVYPGPHGNGLYTQDLYYRILNAGFRLPPTAGSASGVLPNPVGYNRVYVHTGEEFSWEAWWEGLRMGRCFVTNGPLLRVTANGAWPGADLRQDGPLEVRIEGELDTQDLIDRLEVVIDGEAREIRLPATITMRESGWFLVRAVCGVEETFRFASTAPWFVEIDGKPRVPRREAVRFFLEWAKERREMVRGAIDDGARRAEVVAWHTKAVAFWEERLARAAGR